MHVRTHAHTHTRLAGSGSNSNTHEIQLHIWILKYASKFIFKEICASLQSENYIHISTGYDTFTNRHKTHDTTYIGNKHSCNKRAIYPQWLEKLRTQTIRVSPLLSSTADSSSQWWSKWWSWVPFSSGFISNSATTSIATAATSTTASYTTTSPTTTLLWSAISVTLYIKILKKRLTINIHSVTIMAPSRLFYMSLSKCYTWQSGTVTFQNTTKKWIN